MHKSPDNRGFTFTRVIEGPTIDLLPSTATKSSEWFHLVVRNEGVQALAFQSVDIDALAVSPVGQLVPIQVPRPYFAFLPLALPSAPDLDQQTWTAAADASAALGELKQACALLPNPRLLIVPALTKEAQATSALEGTYGPLNEMLEARLPGHRQPTPEIREIMAYEQMAYQAFQEVEERGITVGFVCDLQKILADQLQRRPPEPGKIRSSQVHIGPEGATIEESRFVPPPPDDRLRAGLDDWEQWVSEDHDLPVVVRAALAHYQFESLHPFTDGNGRVGRLVILLQLLLDGSLDEPALTISPWLLRRRTEYQDHLLNISRTGDWNPWVRFFCRGIQEQCRQHVAVTKSILDWMADLRSQLAARHWSGTIVSLAEDLIDWPVVTNGWVQQAHGCTAPTAQSAIDRLVDLGVLEELTGRRYKRIYGARTVMNLVESLGPG